MTVLREIFHHFILQGSPRFRGEPVQYPWVLCPQKVKQCFVGFFDNRKCFPESVVQVNSDHTNTCKDFLLHLLHSQVGKIRQSPVFYIALRVPHTAAICRRDYTQHSRRKRKDTVLPRTPWSGHRHLATWQPDTLINWQIGMFIQY